MAPILRRSFITLTGLGSSSTLVVALVKAIYDMTDTEKTSIEVAEEAFHIETAPSKEPDYWDYLK